MCSKYLHIAYMRLTQVQQRAQQRGTISETRRQMNCQMFIEHASPRASYVARGGEARNKDRSFLPLSAHVACNALVVKSKFPVRLAVAVAWDVSVS